jgi:hypothetical protein
MDVKTNHTPDGTYSTTVAATLTDPVTNEPCTASATVNLTVSGTTVFQNFASITAVQGNVQLIRTDGQAKALQQGQDVNPGDIIISNGGSVTLTTAGGTIRMDGKAEAIMLRMAKDFEQIETDYWIKAMDEGFARMLSQSQTTAPLSPPPTYLDKMMAAWTSLKNLIPPKADFLDTFAIFGIGSGSGRYTISYTDDCYSYSLRLLYCGVYFTPTSAVIPKGTSFTITLLSDGTTKTVLEQGSALILDIASGNSVTVSQGQTISVPLTSSGLSLQDLQAAIQSTSQTATSSTSTSARSSTTSSFVRPSSTQGGASQQSFKLGLDALALPLIVIVILAAVGIGVALRRRNATLRAPEESLVLTKDQQTQTICNNCREPNSPEERYCTRCGTSLEG